MFGLDVSCLLAGPCSGSDYFQYFSRKVMHLRSYLSEAGAA